MEERNQQNNFPFSRLILQPNNQSAVDIAAGIQKGLEDKVDPGKAKICSKISKLNHAKLLPYYFKKIFLPVEIKISV